MASQLASIVLLLKTLGSAAQSVAQLSCTDGQCVEDCTNSQWKINECYNTTDGESQIFLSCDGSGVKTITYTGLDCKGAGTSGSMDVAKCLQTSGGTSFINTCSNANAFTTKNSVKAQALSFSSRQPKMLSAAATSVAQLVCTDSECVEDCTNSQWKINECYNTSDGNSQIFLSCDGSGVNRILYTGLDCKGTGSSGQMDTAKCLQSSVGTSFINTCSNAYDFAANNGVKAHALSASIQQPKMLSAAATSVAQLTCTDSECVEDCTNSHWNINQCYNTTDGHSQIFLSCDGSGVNRILYTGLDCKGPGSSGQMDTAKCLQSSVGTSFINTCSNAYEFAAKNRSMLSSTLPRARAFVV